MNGSCTLLLRADNLIIFRDLLLGQNGDDTYFSLRIGGARFAENIVIVLTAEAH